MIHFQVDAAALQRDVPFPLDLLNGRAFISLVMFKMRGLSHVGAGGWLRGCFVQSPPTIFLMSGPTCG